MVGFNLGERITPKMFINIGALLDIPTGNILTGYKGESFINGGLGQITGFIGIGNNFKSTLMHYQMLSAANKIYGAIPTIMATYDTEVNISLDRLEDLGERFLNIPKPMIFRETDPIWSITDKTKAPANKWAASIMRYTEDKINDKTANAEFQCFMDPYTKKPIIGKIPTFVEIDSLTEFEAESTIDMLSGDLDKSDTNTYAMKQGGFKTKFLGQVPRLANSSNTFYLITAQIGSKINMATGPASHLPPPKKLQHLKGDIEIKGATAKFTYLTTNAWHAHAASVLKNATTRLPEYPLSVNESVETDLNTVKLTQLRGKNGVSGCTIELIVSQSEGVLPSLTEFHFIKENGRYGFEGNDRSYSMILMPTVNLARATVRRKLDSMPKLRRAVNITSELLQLWIYHNYLEDVGLLCTPRELYDDIIKLGYDWDMLLTTREYWTIDQYTNKVPFLSVVDLLKMRKELYFPYFLNKDKTPIKQFENHFKNTKG